MVSPYGYKTTNWGFAYKYALYAEVVYRKRRGGPGHWFGMLNAELAFSNLPEALFGGTRALAPKS